MSISHQILMVEKGGMLERKVLRKIFGANKVRDLTETRIDFYQTVANITCIKNTQNEMPWRHNKT